MRASLVAAVIGCAIFAALFVRGRDADWAARELARARSAPGVVVAAAAPSPRRPWLRHRAVAGGRALGGPQAPPDDKLLADGAAEAERSGAFARFLPDGRILAARPAAGGVAVAIGAPASERAPFPFAWTGLALLAGAVLAAAARHPVVALAPLAVLAGRTAGWPAAAAVLAAAVAAAVAEKRGLFAALRRHRVAYSYLLPAAAAMLVLAVVPFAIGLVLGFYDHAHGEWYPVGVHNFAIILGDSTFWLTLVVTLAWTATNVALHVVLGVALALALREPWVRLRALWRVLLILPWAVPNYITALIWRGMFQRQFGAINALFAALGIPEVSWFSHFATSFAANVTTNAWLGFPFMMVVALGALQSIPRDLYEAAAVDGAGAWQRFRHITLPGLRPALLPAVLLGSIWTFNMFNVIYLVSGGKPAGTTDILVTQAYRWAFERGQRYGVAAAMATLIFLILAAWTALGARITRRRP